MKSLLLVAMGLLLISSVASAELILDNDVSFGPRTDLDACTAPILISQSATQPVTLSTTGGVFTCGNTLYSYVIEGYELRKFSPYWDLGIMDPISIKSVAWGVRRYVATDSVLPAGTVILPYNPADGPLIVDVMLYKIDADLPFTFDNMELFHSQPVEVPYQVPPDLVYNLPMNTIITENCAYDPSIDPKIYDLVVAIHNPATWAMINPVRFAACAMANAETAESYTAWPDSCGMPDGNPYTPTDLGAPGASKFALEVCAELCTPPAVTGACCNLMTGACTITPAVDCTYTWTSGAVCNVQICPMPVPTEVKSWGQVKSLYR